MSISSAPAPAFEQDSLEIRVGERVAMVSSPENLSPEDVAIVVEETRRLCQMLDKNRQQYDIARMFDVQVKRRQEIIERDGKYAIYMQVMERFGVTSPMDMKTFMNYRLTKHKIAERMPHLLQRAKHIMEQGWEVGTLLETIGMEEKRLTLGAVSKECRISFLNTPINNCDPLGYKTARNR